VGTVANELEIGCLEAIDVLHLWVDLQDWKGTRCALELRLKRLNVVLVDVGVAKRVHKFARLETTNLSDHQR